MAIASTLNTLIIIGVVLIAWKNRCNWFQLCGSIGDLIKGGSSSGGGTSSGRGGGYTKGGKGGYIGTPGWYTINGHHHCNMGESGCVCTDPKKCCRTGYPPRNDSECRPDLDRYGKQPKSLCSCAPYAGGKQVGKTKGYYTKVSYW